MNGYKFHRAWYNFVFDNPGVVRTQHTSLYLFMVETCNRLGWKRNFGLPTNHAMEGSSIGNYQTFRKTFDDLIKWGFIKLIQKSTNQYSANVVALCITEAAKGSALDRALMNQCNSTEDIVKPQTSKTLNNKKMSEIEISEVPLDLLEIFEIGEELRRIIEDYANSSDIPLKKVSEAKYKSWLDPLIKMVREDGLKVSHLKDLITYLRSSDNQFWQKTVLDTRILRKNSSKILAEIKSQKRFSGNISASNSLTKKFNSYE